MIQNDTEHTLIQNFFSGKISPELESLRYADKNLSDTLIEDTQIRAALFSDAKKYSSIAEQRAEENFIARLNQLPAVPQSSPSLFKYTASAAAFLAMLVTAYLCFMPEENSSNVRQEQKIERREVPQQEIRSVQKENFVPPVQTPAAKPDISSEAQSEKNIMRNKTRTAHIDKKQDDAAAARQKEIPVFTNDTLKTTIRVK